MQELLSFTHSARVMAESFGVNPDVTGVLLSLFVLALFAFKAFTAGCKFTSRVYRWVFPRDEQFDKLYAAITDKNAMWLNESNEVFTLSYKFFFYPTGLIREIWSKDKILPDVLTDWQKTKLSQVAIRHKQQWLQDSAVASRNRFNELVDRV